MFTRAILLIGVLQWSAITAQFPVFKTREQGEAINFTCPANLTKNYKYMFYKSVTFGSEKLLIPDARTKQVGHILMMSDLNIHDSGKYSCSIYDQNDNKIDRHLLGILAVLRADNYNFKITEPKEQSTIVNEYTSFEFRCEYEKGSTEFIWEKRSFLANGIVREDKIPRDKITVLTDSRKSVEEYHIKKVSFKDTGTYRCRVLEKGTLRSTGARVLQVKQFCIDGGRKYEAGDRFISANCASSCKCVGGPRGVSVTCVSLCPPELIRCGMDEEQIELRRKIPNSNCTCPQLQCVKRRKKDVCIDGDDVYNPGQTFISTDCNRCTCISGIGAACQELCPLVEIICQPGEVKKQWSEQIPESKCSCPRWKCVKKADEFCEMFGERHKIGEYFIPKDCHGYCRCYSPRSFGCVSLCPPHGIYCRPGTRQERTVRPIYGSNCTCPSWKCVRVESKWHPWSDWTECDAKCGGGLRYRFRTCMENEKCFGPSTETEVCNKAPCSPSYADAPCGALRLNSAEADIWPRCNDQGYFEPLQCDPSTSQCWCVDEWGKVEPGSRRISQKPQCGYREVAQAYSAP